MEKLEVPFGGIYRLTVDGQLVGEFVPGPLWTEIYQAMDAAHDNVSYSWIPFAEDESESEVQRLREAVKDHKYNNCHESALAPRTYKLLPLRETV